METQRRNYWGADRPIDIHVRNTICWLVALIVQELARQREIKYLSLKSVPKSESYWADKQRFVPVCGEQMRRAVPPRAAQWCTPNCRWLKNGSGQSVAMGLTTGYGWINVLIWPKETQKSDHQPLCLRLQWMVVWIGDPYHWNILNHSIIGFCFQNVFVAHPQRSEQFMMQLLCHGAPPVDGTSPAGVCPWRWVDAFSLCCGAEGQIYIWCYVDILLSKSWVWISPSRRFARSLVPTKHEQEAMPKRVTTHIHFDRVASVALVWPRQVVCGELLKMLGPLSEELKHLKRVRQDFPVELIFSKYFYFQTLMSCFGYGFHLFFMVFQCVLLCYCGFFIHT